MKDISQNKKTPKTLGPLAPTPKEGSKEKEKVKKTKRNLTK